MDDITKAERFELYGPLLGPDDETTDAREGVHAYLTGRGRVWVEMISGDSAVVRFDCDDGLRGPRRIVRLADIDFTREWKRRNA
jgi:hypothetical protein